MEIICKSAHEWLVRNEQIYTPSQLPKYQGPQLITLDFLNHQKVAFYNKLHILKKVVKYDSSFQIWTLDKA